MAKDLKIVVIGAGSASFGLETLSGIINQEILKNNAELCLVDINETNLKATTALAKLVNQEWKSSIRITSTTDRTKALPDTDFVVLSVAVDREETWIKDHELAKKYGIYHYAENGGPGSFGHTARGLAFIMPILNDIHDLAPDAWIINYTNPVPRIGYAAQHANVKCVGLCHQIWHSYAIVGRYLAKELDITDPKLLDYEFKWNDESIELLTRLTSAAYPEYEIKAAGLNHFIWLLDIRGRDSWEDKYPLIREESSNVNPNFEPLTQHAFKVFGLLPGSGDTHLAEYVPYTVTKDNWQKYKIQLYDFQWAKQLRAKMWKRINEIVTGKREMDLQPNPAERADSIITEMYTNANAYEQSVNVINNGSISNLPNDAIVEVPALVSGSGVMGMKVGPLPEAIAALCRREITIAKLITKASIEGDKVAAIQAFALDTMVRDLDKAEKMVDEYLTVHKKYLPQFFGK
ncbi:MAG: family 4 glycosyl hydrolase [Candidatus Hodarchaeales archaeon]|jgi:alpha-galactosidase